MESLWIAIALAMRITHISSVIVLMGAMVYVNAAPDADRLSGSYRRWLWWSALLAVLSGVYNLFAKQSLPPNYLIWLAVKALLAMHIVAVSFVLTRASVDQKKRERLVKGVVISGAAAVGIAGYLRFISSWMQP